MNVGWDRRCLAAADSGDVVLRSQFASVPRPTPLATLVAPAQLEPLHRTHAFPHGKRRIWFPQNKSNFLTFFVLIAYRIAIVFLYCVWDPSNQYFFAKARPAGKGPGAGHRRSASGACPPPWRASPATASGSAPFLSAGRTPHLTPRGEGGGVCDAPQHSRDLGACPPPFSLVSTSSRGFN